MADNTVLNQGAAGDVIRDIEKGGSKTQVIIQDYGGGGAEDIAARAYGSGVTTAQTPRTVEASDSPVITAINTRTKPADQQHVIIDSGGGGASTIADGADVNAGSTTDVAVATDANGTLSAKVRGIVKLLASVISGGKVLVTTDPISGSVSVSNFPADQLVHATNLDVALSTRLKAADTLTKVTTVDTITNAVTVTGTVTANAGTNLNTSALALEAGNLATMVTQLDTADTRLANIQGDTDSLNVKVPGQGQAPMAQSTPVVVASNQTAFPVTASATSWPLPQGAAQESGGNLDQIVAYQRLQVRQLAQQLLVAQAGPSGFIPMEIPTIGA